MGHRLSAYFAYLEPHNDHLQRAVLKERKRFWRKLCPLISLIQGPHNDHLQRPVGEAVEKGAYFGYAAKKKNDWSKPSSVRLFRLCQAPQ